MTRRKLLIAGGFGVLSAIGVSRLGPSPGAQPGATTIARVASPPTTTPPNPPALAGADPPPPPGHVFERVISRGRVIDPESGFDAVADVGIDSGRITSISLEPLTGASTIDATGLVVAPGFIDILSYAPNDYGVWFKIADGVTTNLGMHGLSYTAEDFFEFYGAEYRRPPVHYGGAFENNFMRTHAADIPTRAATQTQLARLRRELEQSVADGYIGLEVSPEYTPWVPPEELNALAATAAANGLPVYSHIRWSHPGTPTEGSLAAVDELLRTGSETGTGVHVSHITSMTTHVMGEALAKLEDARSRGYDVTACVYPYDFWGTTLASSRFADGWQERFRISYEDLEVAGTGERLTEATFARHQADNSLVVAHAIPEADIEAALRTDWIMIGSDSILEPEHNNHPRATGCFARTLGHYVRDRQVLSLNEALAKMTILPARRVEGRAPAMRRKGRLQRGADADVTVFDPTTVGDRSTVQEPAQRSAGIEYVLVMGTVVKNRDEIDQTIRPGLPIRAEA